ncbi:MAG: rane dipeptidase [Acidobacteriota bacterium]|nr:rane dipeptidase [Acidobacteriota bacterium]
MITAFLTINGYSETGKVDAAEIHDRVLTIDTHVDTPFMLERKEFDIGKINDSRKRGGKVDFPRMKKGGLDAIFFAVFVGQAERNPAGNEKAKNEALETFALIHQAVKAYPDLAQLALTPDDAYRIEKQGKRAIYIGIENGYPLGKDINMVKKFYDLDARYITLCHTRNNDICDSSTDENGPEHNGLSDFGKQVVKEMNRLGMLVDVSHISDKSFYDVLELSAAPVVATHSCSRAVCDNPRNLTDDMLKKLGQNGGVIQMCILSDYVKKMPVNPERDAAHKAMREKFRNYDTFSEAEKKKAREEWMRINEKYPPNLATVVDAVDHIDHIVKVVGIDYVGIGTDFDGGGGLKDCYDVSEMGNITLELVKRGYSEEDIRKIWGGNFMRVFHEVEKVAREIREKH